MMHNQNRYWKFLTICILFGLTGCSGPELLKNLNAEMIDAKGKNCEVLFERHVDAWISREPENLRQVYTDDVVHFDGSPIFNGIGDILSLAKELFTTFPGWKMEAGETYISQDECLGALIQWGLLGFTSDNPGIEFDLLESRDDLISFWRIFYDQKFFDAFSLPGRVDNDFLFQFASSWSAGKTKEILNLYDPEAKIEDTLLGVTASGQGAIRDYVDSFLAATPEAAWELFYPFTEGNASPQFIQEYPYASQGGVFAINVKDTEGKPCEVHAIVILTPDEDGKITLQKNYYNAESLLVCGWAK